MSQEWSRVVSAEVKEEYMTLQGIQTHCSQLTSQNPKTVKSHLSLTLMRVKLVSIYFHYLLICTILIQIPFSEFQEQKESSLEIFSEI